MLIKKKNATREHIVISFLNSILGKFTHTHKLEVLIGQY